MNVPTLTIKFNIKPDTDAAVAKDVHDILSGWAPQNVKALIEEGLSELCANCEFNPNEPLGIALDTDSLTVEVTAAS